MHRIGRCKGINNNSWLVTPEEIAREETTEEKVERLERTVQYLGGRDEEKRLRREEYAEAQQWNPHRYTMFFRMKNKELTKSKMLKEADKAFIFDLLPYINIQSKLITNDRGIPMDSQEIWKTLEISKAKFYVIVNKLVECNVLVKEPYGNKVYYRFNPEHFDYMPKNKES